MSFNTLNLNLRPQRSQITPCGCILKYMIYEVFCPPTISPSGGVQKMVEVDNTGNLYALNLNLTSP